MKMNEDKNIYETYSCTFRERQLGKKCNDFVYKLGYCKTHYNALLYFTFKQSIEQPTTKQGNNNE